MNNNILNSNIVENEENIPKKKSIKGITLVIILFIILVLVVMFLLIPSIKNKNPNTKEGVANTNREVIEDKKVNDLSFTSVSLVYKDGFSKFKAIVTNNTGKDYTKDTIEIILKDKNGKELITLIGSLSGNLKNGKSEHINCIVDMDLSKKAFSVEYVETK